VINKTIEVRSAEALVATFVQMSRSAELARVLQRMRQRTLENRVRRTTDARELVKLQARLDAQQSQAAVLEAATDRFRYQAPNLAQFAKSGLTMQDFERLGVRHVIEPNRLAAEIQKVKLGVSVPVPAMTPRQIERRRGKGRRKSPAAKGAAAKAPAKAPAKRPETQAAAQPEPSEKPHARHRGTAHPKRKRAPRKRSHHKKDDE
jgi:hypothetical protein